MASVHEKELFLQSIAKWGLETQILMLAEEAAELSVACLHSLRKKKHIGHANEFQEMAEEMADVELMMQELEYYLELGSEIQKFRIAKIARLERYLKE
jgi:hypothetical protein